MTNVVFHPPIFALLVSEESGDSRLQIYTKKTVFFVVKVCNSEKSNFKKKTFSNVVDVQEIPGK